MVDNVLTYIMIISALVTAATILFAVGYAIYTLYARTNWDRSSLDLHQSYIEDIDERLRKLEGNSFVGDKEEKKL